MSTQAPGAEVVVVDGPDARSYLDSQCTQDLSALEVSEESMTYLLDPTGVLVTVARVTRTGLDALALEVPWGTGDRTVARLQRFAIRATLTVHPPAPVEHSAVFDEQPRIREGVPGAAELARDLVPHALGAELLERGVSFTKGCYPGQELVARMQARGATPPYVLRRLRSDAPISEGDPVGDAGFAGTVTSVVADSDAPGWLALCVVHRKDATGTTVEVRTSAGAIVAQLR